MDLIIGGVFFSNVIGYKIVWLTYRIIGKLIEHQRCFCMLLDWNTSTVMGVVYTSSLIHPTAPQTHKWCPDNINHLIFTIWSLFGQKFFFIISLQRVTTASCTNNLNFVYVCFPVRLWEGDHVWDQLQYEEPGSHSAEATPPTTAQNGASWLFKIYSIASNLTLCFLECSATDLPSVMWIEQFFIQTDRDSSAL